MRLVENLLDMSRLQAGVLGANPQPLSTADAVAKAAEDLGPAAANVAIQVPDELAEIHADPALVERILANLLSNALRHSPPDQPPMIAASEHAGTVEIRVIDHGPGIPTADRDRVFLPFQRLGDRATPPASDSASPCPADWPKPWAAASTPTPPPAAD